MKAIVRDIYGSPDVLRLEEIPTPSPADNEVLVKVHAAAVNKGDWEILHGSPLWVRLVGFGLMRPKTRILGSNLAGLIALQAIRDKGQVKSGQKVLINGAGGGAGTFAIQLAKLIGAEVTGVDNSEKLDLMRSLGADHVVDYTQEDFAERNTQYDLILDVVGFRSIYTWKRVLQSEGIYVAVGGSVAQIAKTLLLGAWVSWRTAKKIGVLGVNFNKEDLVAVFKLMESGQVAATIDRCYALQDVPEAIRYLGAGHSKGKVVIVM